jgi:hypothetical protein
LGCWSQSPGDFTVQYLQWWPRILNGPRTNTQSFNKCYNCSSDIGSSFATSCLAQTCWHYPYHPCTLDHHKQLVGRASPQAMYVTPFFHTPTERDSPLCTTCLASCLCSLLLTVLIGRLAHGLAAGGSNWPVIKRMRRVLASAPSRSDSVRVPASTACLTCRQHSSTTATHASSLMLTGCWSRAATRFDSVGIAC